MNSDALTRPQLLRPTYQNLLDTASPEDLLSIAGDLVAASAKEATPIAEAAASAILRRFSKSRDTVAAWLEAREGDGGAAELWLHARLWAWLGDAGRASAKWNEIVDRGIGPRAARYLGRARLRLEAGDEPGAAADLREAFREPASYEDMERGWRLLRQIPEAARGTQRSLRIGLLGTFTTQLIVPILELACFRDGIAAEVYEAEFGMLHQEILDPASELRRFGPEAVIIATSWRDGNLPGFVDDVDETLDALVGPLESLWKVCRDDIRCHVLQHNFDLPVADAGGHLSRANAGGRARLLMRANVALLERAGVGISIVDAEGVAARLGRDRWEDASLWYLAKQHPAAAAIPALVDEYLMHLRALVGLSKKVLVLDLDNTVWGGVVGEDGVHGLKLGAHSPEGEAHLALQRYALELKDRGIVLAVCSKNNDADAREPFEKHPEMALRLDDIAAFRANWEDKATNLRAIARTLDLGLDSFVFLDDNPTERAWVRSQLPEVAVPEIGDDPSHYLRILQQHHYFDALTLTSEDRIRAADYAANARRAELRETTGDLEGFLRTLEMTAVVGPFDEANLPRIAQLVNKTNQFNLTTKRYTKEQLAELAASSDCVSLWYRLGDRFGDNGLIGVQLGRFAPNAEVLEIELWLMSCRVLGRRMEEFMLAELAGAAVERGARRLVGRYVPTPKNAMVRDLYGRLGFECIEGDPSGAAEDATTVWERDLAAGMPQAVDFISRGPS